MAGQFAKFDPTTSNQDAVVAGVLADGETMGSTGFGDLVIPFSKPLRGKFFVSDKRLLFVADKPVFGQGVWWRPWLAFTGVKHQKSFLNARLVLDLEGSGSLTIGTTKGLSREIQQSWESHHHADFVAGVTDASIRPDGKMFCHACGHNPDDVATCGGCGRDLRWPGPLGKITTAARSPESVLPEKFPDGSPTNRDFILDGLSQYALAAVDGK